MRRRTEQELDGRLRRFVAAERLPGATAGIVVDGELAWSGSTGFADLATGQPASVSGLYRIASITKTVTGTAIMALRDAGKLSLEDPAVEYLPELRQAASPFASIEAVTLRQLLSHESGLRVEPAGTDWSVPSYQGDPALTLARAEEIAFKVPPYSQHKYSDLAYQLLGEVVTRVSGRPYGQHVTESVLEPLGMSCTAFDPLTPALASRRATGYDWMALSGELSPAGHLPPVWAEGGLWSTVADLGRWICFQLSAYPSAPAASGRSAVLRSRTLREMHKPRYLADDTWRTAWGISWCGVRRDEVTWIQHSGGVPGFTSTVCFDPRTQAGAVVLVNGTTGSTELAFDLALAARSLAAESDPEVTAPEPPPGPYRPFLGVYARPNLGGWLLRLEWRAGRLTFTAPEAPGWQLDLTATDQPEVFTVGPGTNFAGERVTFRRDDQGTVTAVLLVETTFVRLSQPAT